MLLFPVASRPSYSADFARTLDRLFGDTPETTPTESARAPALDVVETEQSYAVSVDLPGVAKDEVKVSVNGRRVTIEAQTRQAPDKTEGTRVLYRERQAAHYARSFVLPVEVDQTASQARLENGVLTLTLNKKAASSASQITVN